jgi:hypothetical protein
VNFPLPPQWTEYLDLSHRKPPELFQTSDEVADVPHAGAVRDSLADLGLSAVFCVQGVPAVAILVQDVYDQAKVTEIHAALWNQGLASLLLAISDDVLRAFSLARRTVWDSEEEFKKRCLVNTLHAVSDVLALKELISGVESGRLWEEHSEYFPVQERVDNALLGNISESHRRLCEEGLSSDASQALLMQTMFISYLEDRSVITQKYISKATENAVSGFQSLLTSGKQELIAQLFDALRRDFNGDLFVAPCSFDSAESAPSLNAKHLSVLSSFRSGKEEMSHGATQLRFWGYNFRYIPVELISAVYDRFLGEKEDERRELGAYYTPMFLADTVISQVWDVLDSAIKDKGTFLDPACGSGVFLVRSFQRLCDHWRATRQCKTLQWESLLSVLRRIYGWDINGNAVRVAVFSLYIALLEQVNPPDFPALVKKGRMLPKLRGETLIEQDFFSVPEQERSYDVIIGNPPWTSRRGTDQESVKWCDGQALPMPGREAAWGFVWKALAHASPQGLTAFLLPAMGFLHNHSEGTVAARSRLVKHAKILRIINFADLRFQLFDGANKAAALILLQRNESPDIPYRFEYWTPKADLNLRLKRLITLSSADKTWMRSDEVEKDALAFNALAFKQRLWMRTPDAKLFRYLSSFSRLGTVVREYGSLKKRKLPTDIPWVIGQGFKPAEPRRLTDNSYGVTKSDVIANYPFLSIRQFKKLALPNIAAKPWSETLVHRKGFEGGFIGPHILIPQGIDTVERRLKATYTEQSLVFQHSIQAIAIGNAKDDKDKAKLLTALLNSKIISWFAFHGTSSFGSDRPKVHQEELLNLPFPGIKEISDLGTTKAAARLVGIIDDLLSKKEDVLTADDQERTVLAEIDALAYEYFGLSEDEISIIEDTVDFIIPAMQPRHGNFPKLWEHIQVNDRQTYAQTLSRALKEWLDDGWAVNISLETSNADLGILRLSLVNEEEFCPYQEHTDKPLEALLEKFSHNGHISLPGNFQSLPDFRIFIDTDLYLVKPMQKRFWLRSTALADADAIAADLQHVLTSGKKAG